MKQRYHYLNILKFIAIFCVCFYHFSSVYINPFDGISKTELLNRFLFSFNSICVPVFMMVNGALLLNRPLNTKKHYKNLMLFFAVYMVWRAITYIALGLNCGYDFSKFDIIGFFNQFVLMRDFGAPLFVDHFWFITVFVSTQLMLPFYKATYDDEKNRNLVFAVLMTALWLGFFLEKDYTLFKYILPAPLTSFHLSTLASYLPFAQLLGIMTFFFILGGFLHKGIALLEKIPTPVYAAVMAVSMAVQTLLWYLEQLSTSAASDLVFDRYGTTTNIVICVSLFMIAKNSESVFAKFHKPFAWFEAIGQNTINIFYLHWIVGKVILPKLPAVSGYAASFAVIFVMVSVCTAIGIAGKKIPFVKYLFGASLSARNKTVTTK